MSAFQVERMVPAVRKILDAPEPGWCATFEVTGVDGAWVQLMQGTLNCAYPFSKRPEAADVVASLPGASMDSWEPGNFVTFAFGAADARAVATAIDRVFTKYFDCGDYPFECRTENFE